jgi:hypothetical protein
VISSGKLRDPGKSGAKWLNRFLKKDEFILKTGKPLLPGYLCKLGAVYTAVSHKLKNMSKVIAIAREALCHAPDNHASPRENYTIANLRKKEEPYDQANPFKIFDEN